MPHDHHGHDDHSHLDDMTARVMALEKLMTDKGLVDPAALEAILDTYETRVGQRNGARVVARAWTDPAFAEALTHDATTAIHAMGFGGRQGEPLTAVFNKPGLHNLVVCTLCSCYPWSVLGLPPVWYKSMPYRARAVSEPRAVLAEFGLTLPEDTAVRVWDSTAEMRYIVIPQRPEGTGGWTAEQLEPLVSRDAMIGTALAGVPA